MENTLLERLKEAKKEYETEYVSLFGEDKVVEDKHYMTDHIKNAKSKNAFDFLDSALKNFARMYTLYNEYDALEVDLNLGIVYNITDIDENNKPVIGAKPIDNLVRIYTDTTRAYLDNEEVSHKLDSEYFGSQGFIDFDLLINTLKKEGLSYNGPESYDELKYRVLCNQKVNATIKAELEKKQAKQKVLTR